MPYYVKQESSGVFHIVRRWQPEDVSVYVCRTLMAADVLANTLNRETQNAATDARSETLLDIRQNVYNALDKHFNFTCAADVVIGATLEQIATRLDDAEIQRQQLAALKAQLQVAQQSHAVNMPLVMKLTKAIKLCMEDNTRRMRDQNTMQAAALLAEVVMSLITPVDSPSKDIDDIPF